MTGHKGECVCESRFTLCVPAFREGGNRIERKLLSHASLADACDTANFLSTALVDKALVCAKFDYIPADIELPPYLPVYTLTHASTGVPILRIQGWLRRAVRLDELHYSSYRQVNLL